MPYAVTGPVRAILRLEGLVVLVAAVACYARFAAAAGSGWGWGVFAACFLLPDASFAGYLAGPRAGSWAYNAAHSYVGPLAVLAAGVLGPSPAWVAAGLIWAAHLGLDRALGYGLKYGYAFGATHLGWIGRAARDTARD